MCKGHARLAALVAAHDGRVSLHVAHRRGQQLQEERRGQRRAPSVLWHSLQSADVATLV